MNGMESPNKLKDTSTRNKNRSRKSSKRTRKALKIMVKKDLC